MCCLFVSFIRQRCVRHNSSSFCKYIRMMIYLLALTKVFLLFLIFCYFMMFLMFSDYFFHLLFDLIFGHNFEKKDKKERKNKNTKHKTYVKVHRQNLKA